MDDKTFIASYVADESTRVKDRLKKMVESETPPTEEEKAAVMQDMEATLKRLQTALSQITPEMLAELEDEEEKPDA
jgi:hypothetical protein